MNHYTYSGESLDPDRITQGSREPFDDSDNDQKVRTKGKPDRKKPSRKKRDEEADTPKFFEEVAAFFRNRVTRAILGVFFVFFAGYLGASAVSFILHYSSDQSKVVEYQQEQTRPRSGLRESQEATDPTAPPAEVTNEEPKIDNGGINNAGGKVGATLAHRIFIRGLGVGSIVLVVYIAVIGLVLLGRCKVRFWSFTMKSLLLAITLSMVLGLVTINSHAAIPLGGFHGKYANIFLINVIGWVGAILTDIFLVAVVVIIFFKQIYSVYDAWREKVRILKARAQLEADRRAAEKEKIQEALDNVADEPDDEPDDIDIPETHSEEKIEIKAHHTPDLEDFEGDDDSRDDLDFTPEDDGGCGVQLDDIEDVQPAPETPNEPEFEITSTAEIEQAKGNDNEAYERQGPYDPRAELSSYQMPGLDLLNEYDLSGTSVDVAEQEANKQLITKVLHDYGVEIVKIEAIVGPTVTLYKIVPTQGTRILTIKRIENEIAMSLAAKGIRIIAPIPGECNIGIEVPNQDPQMVPIRSILGSKAFRETKYKLPMALGATISNEVFIADLTKMPHLLVAGATGQGKSVGLNTIIASLLYKRHPAELKFVLIDPKQVEFSLYSVIEKHYFAALPDATDTVITDPGKVVETLNSLCVEMDDRYAMLKAAGCRNIDEYNEKFIHRRLNPENGHRYMPYIVMIVDEFSDLIMQAGKAVETPIARIAQKARAVGMHLIIATQRPSTNVITGIIKANFPGRMAFAVRQRVDSLTILDCPGANQLIGRGDMLMSTGGALQRVQCAFIDTDEVERLCQFIADQQGYLEPYQLPEAPGEGGEGVTGSSISDADPLFNEIARMIVMSSTASTSNIQRKFSIGYNRAGKIMDQLEAAGIVGPSQGGKPRQVLMSPADLEMYLSTLK